MNHEHENGVCRADCPYRKLYEGSQTSLNDMSARQGSSLSRVGRLRAGIVTTIRRSFPDVAEKAEREMGRRLSEVDDEVLITFIDNLTAGAVRQEERTALQALGLALQSAGYQVDLAANPSTWVAALRNGPSTGRTAALSPRVAEREAQRVRTPANEATPLGDLFGGRPEPTTGLQPVGVTPEVVTPELDERFDQAEWPEDVIGPAPEIQPARSGPDDSNGAPASASLAELFGAELWDGPLGDPSETTGQWSPSPVKPNQHATRTPAAPAAVPPAVTHAPAPPVRPELFPSAPKQKQGRKAKAPRISAEPAYPYSDGDVVVVLDDTLRQALLAASAIPRPVFTRDLVSIAGSPELIAAWEDECRASPESTPVRFIAPKQRHKARGSLVVPDEAIRSGRGRDGDWWTRCIELYRAARLYELGVLLHRLGDEIVSAKFTQHHALLRLNSPRGLVGIIVSTDDRLESGEPGREELAAAIAELLRERLTLVAVLTSAGEERELERMIAAILELAKERAWSTSFPVVAARSWEYADDRGSTSRLVLGG
jgi:hypothetical protein